MAMSDMTLGQYFPAESVIHRLDARIKIVLAIAFMVLAFLVNTLQGYGMVLGLLVVTILLSRVPIRFVLKGLKPILFILIFTFVLNLFLTPGQTVWVHWWIFTITKESLLFAVQMSVRLALLVAGTSMLTLTTAPLQLTDGLESLLRPLKAIRFPVHEMAMMMSIALRFIPTLAEEADRIRKAQAARGADFDTGGLFKRAASLIPLLVPLFVGAFRRAEELATAMEARCYHGGEGRTKLTVMHIGGRDYISLLIMVAAYLLATVGGF
ncbi:MAG: energy-coupling factor transporter transmembrane protein EcfT [Clostridiales bacterium]|nr:energy-coupling factor transporter transmembrane protein EcfT [Clostridiales bacterium]